MHKCSVKECEGGGVSKYKDSGLYLCKKHRTQMDRHGKILRTMYDPNEIIILNDYAEIYIYNNKGEYIKSAIIDIEDVELCKQYKWCLTKDGYVLSYKNNTFLYLHRLLLGAKNNEYVDHINFNTLDNRKQNLRICTNAQNLQHRSKLTKINTSGYHGISFDKDKNRWQVEIQYNKKRKFIGYYKNIEDAIKARRQAEDKYYGEYKSFAAL